MKITNISKGPRGVNAVHGPVLIEPGQSVEADLNDAEYKVSNGTGWFEIEGEAAKPDNELDRDDIKKQADELGIEYAKNIPTEKLKELVDAKLAESGNQ